jgi:hypothetical protein
MPIPPVSGTVPATTPSVFYDPNGGGIIPVSWDVKYDLSDGLAGTFTPTGAVKASSANGATTIGGVQVEELSDSPEIERGEQATITKRFRLPYDSATQLIAILGRGVVLQDLGGNLYRVLSARIQREKPEFATLTIVSEGLTFDLPPDEFSIMPVELGINIMKHPRYFYALNPNASLDSYNTLAAKQAIIRAIQTYQDSPFFPVSSSLNGLLNGQVHNNIVGQMVSGKFVYTAPNPNYQPQFTTTNTGADRIVNSIPSAATQNGDPNPAVIYKSFNVATQDEGNKISMALAAAQEILLKIWRMEDNPYLVGYQITWGVYYNYCPELSPGGYIEEPISYGLPDYFTNDGTIFDAFSILNPQCYSANGASGGAVSISWLRKADEVDYQRTWFKVTRTWIGSAIGAWDTDIFSSNDRPNAPSDYRRLV